MQFRFALPVIALVFLQCREVARTHNWFAMDTNMSVSLFGPCAVSDDSLFFRLEAETERLNLLFSDFSSRSALSEIKGHIGDTVTVDPEIYPVLKIALEASKVSDASFDITLHDLKWIWGLGGGQTGHVPDSSVLDSIMRDNPTYLAGWDTGAFNPPLILLPNNRAILRRENKQIDLGAIAKGYIIDRLHEMLNSLGCPNHILQAGGEIRLGGKKKVGAWAVGIRHPRASDSLCGMIRTESAKAISTSGDYERFFESGGIRYHHIFDPRTGKPAGIYCGLTIVGDLSVYSDALSTSLFILGPEKGMEMARRYHSAAVWFEDRTTGLCAIPMPEILPYLELFSVPLCGTR
jgi:FAD:protein FMN transferase